MKLHYLYKYFAITLAFMLLLMNASSSFSACTDMPTPDASDTSRLVLVSDENLQKASQFPSLTEVEYVLHQPDQPSTAYLNSVYIFNNACLDKIIKAIDMLTKKATDTFNFVSFVNDKILQKRIADVAKVDEFYVRLYISRGITSHIKRCESPMQKFQMLTSFKNFWSEDQRYLLFSLLQIEDLFLRGLLRIKHYFVKYLLYEAQANDFFVLPADPISKEIAKRVATESLPYTVAYITHNYRAKAKWFLCKLLEDHDCLKTSDYNKAGSPVMKFIADIERISQDSDPFLKMLAFYSYSQLNSQLFCQEAKYLFNSLQILWDGIEEPTCWQLNGNKFLSKQITNLMPSFKTENNDILLLVELFLDYHQLSILSSGMNAVMVELWDILKLIAKGMRADHKKETADELISKVKSIKEIGSLMRTRLPELNIFLEDYISSAIPFESLFDEEAKKLNGCPIHAIFHFPDLHIQSERESAIIIKNELMQEQKKHELDLMTVDAIMKIYFSEEGRGQQESNPPQSNAKKSKKKRQPQGSFASKKQAQVDETDDATANCVLSSSEQCKELKCKGEQSVVRYHHRVLRWFDPHYAKLHDQESVIYHTLPPFVDTYLVKEGVQKLWKGNLCYSLPAKITRQDGSFAHVICSCTITKDGQIYHRGFDFSTKDAIKQKFSIDIPDDGVAKNVAEYEEDPFVVVFKKKRLQNRSLLFDDNKEFVMLYDPINKLYVQLFHRT